MTFQPSSILSAFLYLHLKHYLCDFPLQSGYQLRTKGIYGDFGGILHASIHGLATLPVFLLFHAATKTLVAIVVSEFLLHYHIDWLKERILKQQGWDSTTYGFWQILGGDQMLHNFTYVGIVAALIFAS